MNLETVEIARDSQVLREMKWVEKMVEGQITCVACQVTVVRGEQSRWWWVLCQLTVESVVSHSDGDLWA